MKTAFDDRMMGRQFFLTFVLVFPLFLGMRVLAQAIEPDEMLDDPYLEMRARAISKGLRCLVCFNETIDESQAPLARDLRLLVRERLMKGERDDEIVAFIVARYGEFVLLRPTFGWKTAILWLSPLFILCGIFLTLFYRQRRDRLCAKNCAKIKNESTHP